ncbi:MAG: DUF3536 domain-containing protein [Elusimicrobia bacterium]|nr:DUF3536 domain-containing protein [Elusimicrobiota bacterium]
MKYACIHGHFYQPPRENPWTGEIERQPSAGDDHDWNARISRECYRPNGEARIVGADNILLRTANNYSWMSFNFGPTLLNWMETHEDWTYRRILKADHESRGRLNGHGNAIAQAYNHMIMPLANARDRETQVRWGVGDFISRFGRVPESLWLPECAVSDEVMSLLARHRFKYVILSPEQAATVISPEGKRLEVRSGDLDARRPYLWESPDGSGSITVFFYDMRLSQDAAFSHLMSNAPATAERFDRVYAEGEDGLVSLASDGETYGHHQKFAEMGLAYLLTESFKARGISVVNYGWYLSRHKADWRVELAQGAKGLGTSWSCSHGVLRWIEDCGCGSDGRPMAWKKPLRDAFDFLRDTLAAAYEKEAGDLFKDPWEARNDYIRVLRGGKAGQRDFFARHLRRKTWTTDAAIKDRALLLLEMQKYAMFMYTSCGWFFQDITGLEASQNIKYARRALELSHQACGLDVSSPFNARLDAAFSAAGVSRPAA